MILVDTGAVYALTDRRDANHAGARAFYATVAGQEPLAVTLPVLTESWMLIEARLGAYAANKVWEAVNQGAFEVIDLSRTDLLLARDIEERYRDAGFGFVDATCFAVCERLSLDRVFTYDRKHFGCYKPSSVPALTLLP